MRVTISRSRGLASPERSEPDDQPNQGPSPGKPPLDRQAECHLTGLGSPRTRVRKGKKGTYGAVHMPPTGTSPKNPPRRRWGSRCHVADRATTSPAGTPAFRPLPKRRGGMPRSRSRRHRGIVAKGKRGDPGVWKLQGTGISKLTGIRWGELPVVVRRQEDVRGRSPGSGVSERLGIVFLLLPRGTGSGLTPGSRRRSAFSRSDPGRSEVVALMLAHRHLCSVVVGVRKGQVGQGRGGCPATVRQCARATGQRIRAN